MRKIALVLTMLLGILPLLGGSCDDNNNNTTPVVPKPPVSVNNVQLTAVYPSGGPATGGTVMKLVGEGFEQGMEVLVDGHVADSIAVQDANTIICVAPQSFLNSMVDVTIRDKNHLVVAQLSNSFEYRVPGYLEVDVVWHDTYNATAGDLQRTYFEMSLRAIGNDVVVFNPMFQTDDQGAFQNLTVWRNYLPVALEYGSNNGIHSLMSIPIEVKQGATEYLCVRADVISPYDIATGYRATMNLIQLEAFESSTGRRVPVRMRNTETNGGSKVLQISGYASLQADKGDLFFQSSSTPNAVGMVIKNRVPGTPITSITEQSTNPLLTVQSEQFTRIYGDFEEMQPVVGNNKAYPKGTLLYLYSPKEPVHNGFAMLLQDIPANSLITGSHIYIEKQGSRYWWGIKDGDCFTALDWAFLSDLNINSGSGLNFDLTEGEVVWFTDADNPANSGFRPVSKTVPVSSTISALGAVFEDIAVDHGDMIVKFNANAVQKLTGQLNETVNFQLMIGQILWLTNKATPARNGFYVVKKSVREGDTVDGLLAMQTIAGDVLCPIVNRSLCQGGIFTLHERDFSVYNDGPYSAQVQLNNTVQSVLSFRIQTYSMFFDDLVRVKSFSFKMSGTENGIQEVLANATPLQFRQVTTTTPVWNDVLSFNDDMTFQLNPPMALSYNTYLPFELLINTTNLTTWQTGASMSLEIESVDWYYPSVSTHPKAKPFTETHPAKYYITNGQISATLYK